MSTRTADNRKVRRRRLTSDSKASRSAASNTSPPVGWRGLPGAKPPPPSDSYSTPYDLYRPCAVSSVEWFTPWSVRPAYPGKSSAIQFRTDPGLQGQIVDPAPYRGVAEADTGADQQHDLVVAAAA